MVFLNFVCSTIFSTITRSNSEPQSKSNTKRLNLRGLHKAIE